MSQTELVIFLACVSGTTAFGIDTILPALSGARETFGLGQDSSLLALTVTVYFLGLSLAQIIYGPLADRIGRKATLRLGLLIYAVGSVASAFAPTVGLLLLGRLVWGIGGAAPRAMVMTIARDRYRGDRLSRVLSLVSAAFMIVPAIAPLIGQGVDNAFGWRAAFGAPALMALLIIGWSIRLEETLPPQANPLPILKQFRSNMRTVLRTPLALGLAMALMFDFAAFSSFLSTGELVFGSVFDRSAQFPLLFGAMSVSMGLVTFFGSRMVKTMGTKKMVGWLLTVAVVSSALLFIVAVVGSGRPNFWLWFGLVVVTNSVRTLINPLLGAMAMEPMGEQAGTAAAIFGTISMGGGALLASVTDRFTSNSVTPLSSAYLGYGLLEAVAVVVTLRLVASRATAVGAG